MSKCALLSTTVNVAIEPFLIEPLQIDPNICRRKIQSLLKFHYNQIKFSKSKAVLLLVSHESCEYSNIRKSPFQNQNLVPSWLSNLSVLFHKFLLLHKNKPRVLDVLLSMSNQRRNKTNSDLGFFSK